MGTHSKGEGVLWGQAVAATNASALHVVGLDACHPLSLQSSDRSQRQGTITAADPPNAALSSLVGVDLA
jgi:hypothetical protein